MMIWFAGILQTNTCCNKTDENKQTKNTELCVWWLLNNYAR